MYLGLANGVKTLPNATWKLLRVSEEEVSKQVWWVSSSFRAVCVKNMFRVFSHYFLSYRPPHPSIAYHCFISRFMCIQDFETRESDPSFYILCTINKVLFLWDLAKLDACLCVFLYVWGGHMLYITSDQNIFGNRCWNTLAKLLFLWNSNPNSIFSCPYFTLSYLFSKHASAETPSFWVSKIFQYTFFSYSSQNGHFSEKMLWAP